MQRWIRFLVPWINPAKYFVAGLIPVAMLLLVACEQSAPVDPAAHRAALEAWQTARAQSLTAPDGWLSLVGLYWLKPGPQSFGRDPQADLALANANLPPLAGVFTLAEGQVSFAAAPGVLAQHNDQPVDTLVLAPDTASEPTVLSIGTLRFYVIERDGKLGVRFKDSAAPARVNFQGLAYFPIDAQWRVTAEFIPYEPVKHIPILNVLGMKIDMISPGALVFELDGREYRLDPVLEEGSDELFIMLADATSGHETYGAGRYMYVPMPVDGEVVLDFNKAYNPPCAFSDFATCPLPPAQNRLDVRIEAGEKVYGHN